MSLCVRHNCPGLMCEGRGAGCPIPLPRYQQILLGCLHEDENSTIYVTFKEGQWHLITVVKTMGGVEHEVLCRHEDFLEFVELVHEYSDYVEGEEHGEEDN